tara:strand:- start:4840 stop:5082 length:243 start_codon:yes stop_codon:yes gene_type:complete
VPAVNIGTRQLNREHGNNVLHVSYDANYIESAIKKQLNNGRYKRSSLYGDGKSGERIASILSEVDINIKKMLFILLRKIV